MSGYLQAADGRLRRGCRTYQFTCVVTTPSEDWSFDGVITYRLCRWATATETCRLRRRHP